NPENNRSEAATFVRLGARVEQATSLAVAKQYLQPTEDESYVESAEPKYDILISSLRRGDPGSGDRADGGFDDVQELRTLGLHTGPVLFYTLRVTRARRERAEAMGARITGIPGELAQMVEQMTAKRRRDVMAASA
ncbi:MAG TPA: hypothetical protein VJT73_11150, partial [Polyangiaceae bacterium]|nr:hypothetical protein [Polyangiaceae bacterium]